MALRMADGQSVCAAAAPLREELTGPQPHYIQNCNCIGIGWHDANAIGKVPTVHNHRQMPAALGSLWRCWMPIAQTLHRESARASALASTAPDLAIARADRVTTAVNYGKPVFSAHGASYRPTAGGDASAVSFFAISRTFAHVHYTALSCGGVFLVCGLMVCVSPVSDFQTGRRASGFRELM